MMISNKPESWSFYIFLISIILIMYMSVTSGAVPGGETLGDKFLHAGAFFWLFLFGSVRFKNNMLTLAGALIGFGIFIEVVQYFLPWREFSLMDISADILGLLLGYLLLPFSTVFYRRIFKTPPPKPPGGGLH